MFDRVIRYIKLFWYSLFFGMKGFDKLLTTSQKSVNDSSVEVSDEYSGVYKDMLEQNVTQEVEELRYKSYIVANESKRYKYIGNGNAIKKSDSQLSERHGLIDESDNLSVILIQDNSLICEDVLTSLKEVNNRDNKKLFYDYNIKISREIFPRFRIESYVTKLVLKESDGNYVIDLYCSMYPSQFSEKKDRAFLSEVKNIKSGKIRFSDILDFNEISFITSNAWGVDDWNYFSFVDFEFYGIIEYDGHYIFRFGCQSNSFMVNLLDKVYSESVEKKYKNKEAKKSNTFILTTNNNKNDNMTDYIDLEKLENVNFSIDNEEL